MVKSVTNVCDNLNPICPAVDATIETLNINDALEIERLKANTLVKGMIVLDKLRLDERQRLSQTLDVMRACRLFNYEFVSKTPLLALE
jgi:hypothetical protein